ncbi:hypothetical protein RJT34_16743 [Clitoria ternatea]|uniref:Uncharacterized protein n=1 Tax=Clitoria ternatea TaxID=43366 RepID=A0AAN9J999_CLITE
MQVDFARLAYATSGGESLDSKVVGINRTKTATCQFLISTTTLLCSLQNSHSNPNPPFPSTESHQNYHSSAIFVSTKRVRETEASPESFSDPTGGSVYGRRRIVDLVEIVIVVVADWRW